MTIPPITPGGGDNNVPQGCCAAGGLDTATDQSRLDDQRGPVGGGSNTRNSQVHAVNQHHAAVAGPNIHTDHGGCGTQIAPVGVDPTPEPARPSATSRQQAPVRTQAGSDQNQVDTHRCLVATVDDQPTPANAVTTTIGVSLVLADPLLALFADVLDDLETVRIANENRLRQLTRTAIDNDGEERGFGLTPDMPAVHTQLVVVRAMLCTSQVVLDLEPPDPGERRSGGCCLEHDAERNLTRRLWAHPLGSWMKAQRGVGPKQGARLLAAVGDPYWNTLHNRPRLVSELWSYCGYGDARRQVRRRGERANWSATAKMRAHLVAVSIVRAGGPYREVYDQARTKYTDAIHDGPCVRCGPSGHPAEAGTSLSAGHQHARALRAVVKEVLRGLWREAKRLHEEGT